MKEKHGEIGEQASIIESIHIQTTDPGETQGKNIEALAENDKNSLEAVRDELQRTPILAIIIPVPDYPRYPPYPYNQPQEKNPWVKFWERVYDFAEVAAELTGEFIDWSTDKIREMLPQPRQRSLKNPG